MSGALPDPLANSLWQNAKIYDLRRLLFFLNMKDLSPRVKKNLKKTVAAFSKNPTTAALKTVYKLADRAAKTNIIHKNKAARLKSRLSNLVKSPTKTRKKSNR